jgi:HEAT repeat protein
MTSVARLRLAGDVDGLCQAVHGDDAVTAAQAAALLGDLGGPRAVDTLLDFVRRHDERCRVESYDEDRLWPLREVVSALGRLRVHRAVPLLCRLLDGGTALSGPPLLWLERTTLRALVDIGAPEAAEALMARLAEHPDSELLQLLGELREPGTVVPLLALLWSLLDLNGEDAVRALGELRDPRTAPALLYLADSTKSSTRLRRAALAALTTLPGAPWDGRHHGQVEQSQLWRLVRGPDRELAHLAAELLTRTGYGRHTLNNVVYYTARRYSAGSDTGCVAACAAISRNPAAFVDQELLMPELVTLLGAARPRTVRRAVAEALGALGGQAAVEALLNALDDARVADTAGEVLGRLPEPPVQPLTTRLRQGNPAAALALGVAGSTDAAPPLLAALDPACPLALRAAAAEALGRLEHRPAAEPLSALAADEAEPSGLRARAVRALGLIGDPGTIPVLLDASRSAAESVRLRAAQALGHFPRPEVVTDLGALARDENPDIGRAAVKSLGQVGKPGVPTLSALVEHAPQWPVPAQRELVTALAATPGPEPVDALVRLSERPFRAEIRAAAAKCMSDRHDPACEAPLLRFIDDQQTQYWHEIALRGLAGIGSAAAVDRVVAYFEDRRYFHHRPHRDETLAALSLAAERFVGRPA